MKKTSNLACLFGLGLLTCLFSIASFNVVNGADKGITIKLEKLPTVQTAHKARLIKLFLWDGSNTGNVAWMTSSKAEGTLDIYNGFVVGSGVDGSAGSGLSLVVIGGGNGNKLENGTSDSGIAGGIDNKISGSKDSAIGGGSSNTVNGNNGIVAGGSENSATDGIVLGGNGNEADGGIVLGGIDNRAGTNGLSMGQSAKGLEGSFVRNDGTLNETADNYSALIGAKNGVLIDTYTPKDGVNLVVNGPIKIGSNSTDSTGTAGEIRSINGCLYAYDGSNWHILGKNSGECRDLTVAKTCEFGRVLLQQGDVVTGYAISYGSKNDCKASEKSLTCSDGSLGGTYYPSCFEIDASPYYY